MADALWRPLPDEVVGSGGTDNPDVRHGLYRIDTGALATSRFS